jgi:hypothetical protein
MGDRALAGPGKGGRYPRRRQPSVPVVRVLAVLPSWRAAVVALPFVACCRGGRLVNDVALGSGGGVRRGPHRHLTHGPEREI